MNDKKIVFFDIDGTLLDADKQIPYSTKKSIQKLQESGVYVAISTGRAPFTFAKIRDELGIQSYVSLNGQYVVFEGKVIFANPIDTVDINRLFQEANGQHHPMIFMGNREMCATVGDSLFINESFHELQFEYPKVDPEYFLKEDIYQALLFCKDDAEVELAKNHTGLRFVRWHPYACDILPVGASKSIGVQKLIESGGFDHQNTYAFGDGLNDMEMLKQIGTGIAMGNAISSLKQVADHVTTDVSDDGIMCGLQKVRLI